MPLTLDPPTDLDLAAVLVADPCLSLAEACGWLGRPVPPDGDDDDAPTHSPLYPGESGRIQVDGGTPEGR